MKTRTKIIIGALALATLLPTGAIVMSTGAAANSPRPVPSRPVRGFWVQRWIDHMPITSRSAATIRNSAYDRFRIR